MVSGERCVIDEMGLLKRLDFASLNGGKFDRSNLIHHLFNLM